MGDPRAETTKYTSRNAIRGKTEILCQGLKMSEDCRSVLLHMSESMDRIDARLDGIQTKMAKGDPDQAKAFAVLQDRVKQHSAFFAFMGVTAVGQFIAVCWALIKAGAF